MAKEIYGKLEEILRRLGEFPFPGSRFLALREKLVLPGAIFPCFSLYDACVVSLVVSSLLC